MFSTEAPELANAPLRFRMVTEPAGKEVLRVVAVLLPHPTLPRYGCTFSLGHGYRIDTGAEDSPAMESKKLRELTPEDEAALDRSIAAAVSAPARRALEELKVRGRQE